MATSSRPLSTRRRAQAPEPPLTEEITAPPTIVIDAGLRDPKIIIEAMRLLGRENRYAASHILAEKHGFSRTTARNYLTIAEKHLAPSSESQRDKLRAAMAARIIAGIDAAMEAKDFVAVNKFIDRMSKLFGLDAAPARPRVLDGFFGREAPSVIDIPTTTAEDKQGSAAPLSRSELRELREFAKLAASDDEEAT